MFVNPQFLLKKWAEKEGACFLTGLEELIGSVQCLGSCSFWLDCRIVGLGRTVSHPSSGASRRQNLGVGNELDQPFEILGGGSQVKLLDQIPESAQSHPLQPDPQIEFRGKRFNLVPFAPGTGVPYDR